MDTTSLRNAWKSLQARLGIRHVNLFSNSDFFKKCQQITQHQRPWSFMCIAFQGDKNDQSFPFLNPPITLNPKFAKLHRTSLGLHAFCAAVAERHHSVVLHASIDIKPPTLANPDLKPNPVTASDQPLQGVGTIVTTTLHVTSCGIRTKWIRHDLV